MGLDQFFLGDDVVDTVDHDAAGPGEGCLFRGIRDGHEKNLAGERTRLADDPREGGPEA